MSAGADRSVDDPARAARLEARGQSGECGDDMLRQDGDVCGLVSARCRVDVHALHLLDRHCFLPLP